MIHPGRRAISARSCSICCCRRAASCATRWCRSMDSFAAPVLLRSASSPRRFARAAECRSPRPARRTRLAPVQRAGNGPRCITQARAALRYDDQARRLMLPFKHADRTELAPVLASMMRRAGAALLAPGRCLVPVPLHRRRLYERKYNQAALLAMCLGRRAERARAAGCPGPDPRHGFA